MTIYCAVEANSDLPYDSQYPIFIPNSSRLAQLIVLHAHERVYHKKEKFTLVQIRSEFWIPQCRQLVRSILKKCILCRRLEGIQFAIPPEPPLPKYRVEFSAPFTAIGFDHMGPIWVRDIYKNVGSHKAYVALSTCCTTRMLHLELQPNLESPACIRALRRTFARVGSPKMIITDNHKTFRSKSLQRFAANEGMDWKFILELSPHWGGFYERLNGLIKRALRKTLCKAKLTYEEVDTILIEIEAVCNSRPLGYVYDDDVYEPLTPSHLMHGRRLMNKSTSTTLYDDCAISKRYEYLRTLLKHFWKRFSAE